MPRILELFSGTGSIGKVFAKNGWEVVSVDVNPHANPTVVADIMTWNFHSFSPDSFDVVWASPPCTQYSRARTRGGARKLDEADAIVLRTLYIISYFRPEYWFIENPFTGLLKSRPVMLFLDPPRVADYCMYGAPYRKRTAVWTNNTFFKPMTCNKACGSYMNGRHTSQAQRGEFVLNELYQIPEPLCEAVYEACQRR